MPLVAVVLVLASCTSEAPGTPTTAPATSTDAPTSTSAPTTKPSGDLPANGAPKVDTSVDPGGFLKKPCLAFTEAQRKELGLADGEQRRAPLGEECNWRSNGGGSAHLSFLEGNPHGLSGTYAANKDGRLKYFEPTEVGGQPAVFASPDDARTKGACVLLVGMSDKLVFSMTVQQSPDKVGTGDPCQVTARVAGMALTTIKAG
ncbi:DUF3558 domain-containing protein [Alloactinosynnema sp. L-07]|uniref:DUF3558 domain-containing protein n=1 Tax=Alloactinosynnema sp. L-07 TaxID=1653480 RepID=UPI00155FDF35|nr:DUF3558 domain-containing protein [Alloactinosynnema sp. L-07]